MDITFRVHGTPAPQGNKGRVVLTEASKTTRSWRDSVAAAARETHHGPPFDGPTGVSVTFYMRRPKSVKRVWPSVAPDVDKLARTVLDALQIGGVVTDDARVVELAVAKVYGDDPGANVSVWDLEGEM